MKKIYLTIALLITTFSAIAQTSYYVNDNSTAGDVFTTAIGNNANPGTAAAPFATINFAVASALAGDIIYVDAGNYTLPALLSINKSISILGPNYTISPNDGADKYQYNTGRNTEARISSSNTTRFVIGADNIIIKGLYFSPTNRAITSGNAFYSHIKIEKNYFDVASTNISLNLIGAPGGSSTNLALDYNISDNRFKRTDGLAGVSVFLGGIKDIVVDNNVFLETNALPYKSTAISTAINILMENMILTNNLFKKLSVGVFTFWLRNSTLTQNLFDSCSQGIIVPTGLAGSFNVGITANTFNNSRLGRSIWVGIPGGDLGGVNNFSIANNIINQEVNGITGTVGAIQLDFYSISINGTVYVQNNKINITGDYATASAGSGCGIIISGSHKNTTISGNELNFSATGLNYNGQNVMPPVPTGVYINTDGGTNYGTIHTDATINIINNKIQGFKNSVAIYDPSATGTTPEVGYGHLIYGTIVNINENSFTNDSMSVNNGDDFDNDMNVRCNWFGSKADQDIFTKISYQSITAIPWLTNGTDNDPATGFQPVPGSCDGYPPVIVLNSYTNATCPGANNGTININVSLGMAPFIFTWTKAGDPGFISHDEDPADLSPGTYHLSVVDGNGSTIYVDADINYSNSIDVNIVTIPDTEAPVITCPAAITVSCDGSTLPAATGFATAADNCTAVANISITFTDISTKDANPANNAYYNYTITRTWKAVDANENFITCNQIITAHDVIAPVISCPPNPTLNCQDNNSSASTGEATATDNCSPVTITQSQTSTQTATGAGHYNYVITRTWKASDVTGNFSTCMQAIMVRDITSPEITCVTNQSRLTNSGMCTYQVQGAEFNATATDNCAVPALSYVLTGATTGSGTNSLGSVTLNRGTTTISWKATDPSGNFKSCSFNIIVNDDLNPTGYIIYATKEAEFGEKNYINGDVGVTASNGKAEFKKYDVLDPYTVTAKNISIQLPTSVNNRVYNPATGGPNPTFLVHVANPLSGNYNATTNGMVPAGNFKNLTIKKGVIATVNGSDYGNISIEEGAVVTFTSSNINLEELTIGKGKNNGTTTVIFTNPGSVKVSKKVMVEEDCNVNVGGPKITFYLGDNNPDKEKFTVKGDNTLITLNIMIPKGKLMVDGHDRNIIMTGWYIVEELEGGGKNQNITWNKYDCSPPAPLQSLIKPTEPFKETPAILEEVKDQFKVNAYPNPTAGEFSLQVFSNSNDPFMIRIMDMKGVVKSVNTIVSKTSVIKVGAGLIGGTYIAELTQGNKRTWVKLVKLN